MTTMDQVHNTRRMFYEQGYGISEMNVRYTLDSCRQTTILRVTGNWWACSPGMCRSPMQTLRPWNLHSRST